MRIYSASDTTAAQAIVAPAMEVKSILRWGLTMLFLNGIGGCYLSSLRMWSAAGDTPNRAL